MKDHADALKRLKNIEYTWDRAMLERCLFIDDSPNQAVQAALNKVSLKLEGHLLMFDWLKVMTG
jgi:hypothetical protein